MGRVSTQQSPSPSSPQTIKHMSHPHELHPTPCNPQTLTLCSGCKLPSNGTMYTCMQTQCHFSLHHSCAQLPQHITHPSHPGCRLSLQPTAPYPNGRFSCDACSRLGDGFMYHCKACEFDLDVVCAKKPLKIKHHSHPCGLELTFKNPYENSKGFSCDICKGIGEKQWLYRCNYCEFDVHLDCTKSTQRSTLPNSPMLQHHHSFPGGTSHYSHQMQAAPVAGIPLRPPNPLMHSASTGHQFVGTANPGQVHGLVPTNQHLVHNGGFANPQMVPMNPNPHMVPINANPQMVLMNENPHMAPMNQGFMPGNQQMMPSANTGHVPNNQPIRTNNNSGIGKTLMMAAVQGVAEGAFQQVGQNVMAGIIGGGGGGGSGDGGIFGDAGIFGDSGGDCTQY